MTLSPIDALPGQVSDIAAAIAGGAAAVARASVPRWVTPHEIGDIASLGRASVTLRMCFQRQSADTVLFFFTTGSETYVPVDATVSFVASPAAEARPVTPLTRRIGLPPFFLTSLSDGDVVKYGPPGATRDNTVFIGFGDAIFAMEGTTVRYSKGGVPGPVESRRYRLEPFLRLLFLCRDWVVEDMPAQSATVAAGANGGAVGSILGALVESYAAACRTLNTPTPTLVWRPYGVSGFAASVRLRLREGGEIAEKAGEEIFQLAARLNVAGAAADVVVGPPDISASGPLLAAFLDELAFDPACRGPLAHILGVHDIQVTPFIDSARAGAIAVRVGREGSSDRELLWLPGSIGGERRNLLLGGVFQVKTSPAMSVVVDGNYDLTPIGDPADRDTVSYFFRLVDNIRLWVRLLS